MSRKLPDIAETTKRVKNSIERSLTVAETIGGRRALGGSLGKRFAKKALDANTAEFDQFLKDMNFLITNYTKDGKANANFSIERLRTSVASLRNLEKGGKK